MRIKVEQHHIDRGDVAEVSSCPIALAIWEQFPNATRVQVGCTVIEIATKEGYEEYLMPPEAMEFVEWFDSRKGIVKPFEFEVGESVPELEPV